MESNTSIRPSALIDAALAYQNHGWAPIPLLPRGKTPAYKWQKFQQAPPSRAQIRDWWTTTPDFNIAVVMGAASGNLIAVDIDPRNGGDKSIRGLHLPPTFATRTGGGGWHCLYQATKPLPKRTGALLGVDLLGQGSYAVMPPSIHPNGKPYELVIDTQIEPSPAWVVEAMLNRGLALQKASKPIERSLDFGSRNDKLFRAACGFARGSCAWCAYLPCRASSSSHLFKRVLALNRTADTPLERDEVWRIADNAWNLVRAKTAQQRTSNSNGLLLT